MKTSNGVEKPLAEWTLKDAKEFCGLYTCVDCQLYNFICYSQPIKWKIEEKPKFTAQEIEDAKTIYRLIGTHFSISRTDDFAFCVAYNISDNGVYDTFFEISSGLFPTIKRFETYCYQEIIGGSDA